MDCPGPVKAAYWDAYGIDLPDFRLYGREPFRDGLVKYAIAALGEPVLVAPVRMSDLRVDDVILLRFDVNPHHVAIVADHDYGGTRALTMIHADGWAPAAKGKRTAGKVHEHRMTADFVERITHVFRRPV